MILTTIDKKENYCPIKQVGNKWVINWGYKEIVNSVYDLRDGKLVAVSETATNTGTFKYYSFNHKPTAYEIKNVIYNDINEEVSFNIKNCFTWGGCNVYLSETNQLNYKAAHDLAIQTNGNNLPVTFKFSKGSNNYYYTFNTIDELTDFYSKSVLHINNCLSEGWKQKDAINLNDYTI